MKTRIILLLLVLNISCDKDMLLFEQVEVDTNGVSLNDGCADVQGFMYSESEAGVYAGTRSIYTNDGFKTFSYLESTGTISCSGSVLYFDGLTAWILNSSNCSRESFQGQPLYTLNAGYPGYVVSPPLVPDNYLRLFPPYFVNDKQFVTAGRSGNVIHVYQGNTTVSVATKVGATDAQADWWNPSRMFRVNNVYVMTVRMDGFGSRPVSVFTSNDLVNWQGPFAFDVLEEFESIVDISGSASLLIARVVDPPQTTFKVSEDAGTTWAPLGPGKNFTWVQALDNQTIFAIAPVSEGDRGPICKLHKSSNAGATWSEEQTLFYGERIHFYDESNGIAMANGTLQITSDGGKTWKLVLVTPF